MGGVRPGRVFGGWLVLVGLYTAVTYSERLAQAVGLANSWVVALSSPDRPLIQDHRGKVRHLVASNAAGGGTPSLGYPTPSGGDITGGQYRSPKDLLPAPFPGKY